jgi:hypothetical protein
MITREQQRTLPQPPHGSRPAAPRPVIRTRAELVECNCPEACDRDHEQD